MAVHVWHILSWGAPPLLMQLADASTCAGRHDHHHACGLLRLLLTSWLAVPALQALPLPLSMALADHRPRGAARRAQLPPPAGGAEPRGGHLHVGCGRPPLLRLPLRLLSRQPGALPPQGKRHPGVRAFACHVDAAGGPVQGWRRVRAARSTRRSRLAPGCRSWMRWSTRPAS